jgi:hypothetical protein
MANVQAGGQSAVPEAGERPLAVNGDQRLLQALTTEHFTLQTARSATIMETNGRSTLFLSTVSSAVVALAFIGQVADDSQPFFLFALAVLPTLFFLGLLTYLHYRRWLPAVAGAGPMLLGAALVAGPPQELLDLGLQGGLQQQPHAQAGNLLQDLSKGLVGREQLVDLGAGAFGG